MNSLEFVNGLKDTLITYTSDKGTFDTTIYHYHTKEMDQLEKDLLELQKYKESEKDIGCPLKVYTKLKYDTSIYDENGVKWYIEAISKDNFISAVRIVKENGDYAETKYKFFELSEHKKTWWLNEDKSE